MKYFVVSDVHSFYNELIIALNKQGFEFGNAEHKLIICGDVFDRGPDAVKLFEYLKSLGDQFIYVRGNHEDLLIECLDEVYNNVYIGRHHFSNNTVDTLRQFVGCSLYDFQIMRSKEFIDNVRNKLQPVVDWINQKSVNYFTAGDYIFVHGWVPCICDDLNIYHARKNMKLAPLDWWDNDEDYDATEVWQEARWLNGMAAWKQGAKIDGKTIVCGHFHCSYGWSHIRQQYKEFPEKNHPDFEKSFQPFIDEGIIALDACTAYTDKVNCIVLEV